MKPNIVTRCVQSHGSLFFDRSFIYTYLISPAAMKMGSLLSRLVMLSTENWEMLSQLLVWISGS